MDSRVVSHSLVLLNHGDDHINGQLNNVQLSGWSREALNGDDAVATFVVQASAPSYSPPPSQRMTNEEWKVRFPFGLINLIENA